MDPEGASTTFIRQTATALSVLSEDPDLYLDIQHLWSARRALHSAKRYDPAHGKPRRS